MTEPSLRDTAIEQALSVYVVEDLLGRHVPAGDAVRDFVTEGVDATLSVIREHVLAMPDTLPVDNLIDRDELLAVLGVGDA